MPGTDHIRTLLQTARSAADALSSTLGEIEAELAGLEQEAATQAVYCEGPWAEQEDQDTFTEDECAADGLIETWGFPRAYSSYEQFERK